MTETRNKGLIELKDRPFNEVQEYLINNLYSGINSLIADVINLVISNHDDIDLLIHLVKDEFELCIEIEKKELFPLLIHLEKNNKKAENCKPFNLVKTHYKSIINNIQVIKKTIANYTDANILVDLIFLINELEVRITETQRLKDKYYFLKFKNCGGCQ